MGDAHSQDWPTNRAGPAIALLVLRWALDKMVLGNAAKDVELRTNGRSYSGVLKWGDMGCTCIRHSAVPLSSGYVTYNHSVRGVKGFIPP